MPSATDAAVTGRRRDHLIPAFQAGVRLALIVLAVSITIQVVGELLGRLVSLLRLLVQAFQADGLEITCDPRHEPRRGYRVVLDDLADGVDRRLAHEGRRPVSIS